MAPAAQESSGLSIKDMKNFASAWNAAQQKLEPVKQKMKKIKIPTEKLKGLFSSTTANK
jgi:hypothetical protein